MSCQKIVIVIWILLIPIIVAATPRSVTIGLVSDGPDQRQLLPVNILQHEVKTLLTGEFNPRFPKQKQLDGNWSIPGIQSALKRQLNDSEIDIVVTMGWISSNEAAKIKHPEKPIIAAFGGDPALQGFPFKDGVSGRPNFVYLYDFKTIQQNLTAFHQLNDFDELSILIDPLWLDSIPDLENKVSGWLSQQKLDLSISLIPAVGEAKDIVNQLPNQPVYLTPLLRLNENSMKQLAQGLIKKGLPSFSEIGRADVQLGILGGQSGGADDEVRRARRIANIILRLMSGASAAEIGIGYNELGRLIINMQTAKSIGLDIGWNILDDAELLHDSATTSNGKPLSLIESMELALQNNLDLQSINVNSVIALEEIGLSRSTLLPQLGINTGYQQIDRDRASRTDLAQGNATAGIELSQNIYSDRTWADYRISQYNKTAIDYQIQAQALDTMQLAASSYLALLQAQAQEAVQRSNLELSREHRHLAKMRERVGTAGHGEVLRWNSQIATNKQNLLAFQSQRLRATTALNRILNRPVIEAVDTSQPQIKPVLEFMNSTKMLQYIETPKAWQSFQDYYLQKAVDNAPELGFFQPRLAAQEREILSNKRSYYIPDIQLNARYARDLHRNGAGSSLSGAGLDRDAWTVRVQATLPLFAGGLRQSRLSRSKFQLQQLKIDQSSVKLRVQSAIAAALQKIEASFPSIELTRIAETNARDNLKLIADQYARGSVSITQLIDAQNAALVARLESAVAKYTFLTDLIEVLRASADFSLILDKAGRQNLLLQLAAFKEE
ncbi:MAG: TolC family protein [Gammaproteobacteria bacterium]|nr:TolC family protein [Gammaproteobacteria bacterium]